MSYPKCRQRVEEKDRWHFFVSAQSSFIFLEKLEMNGMERGETPTISEMTTRAKLLSVNSNIIDDFKCFKLSSQQQEQIHHFFVPCGGWELRCVAIASPMSRVAGKDTGRQADKQTDSSSRT